MSPYLTALFHYLRETTPDQWHQVAWSWNWDSGLAPLQWIIHQPQCDKGTAVLIYWHGGARWFAQFAVREVVASSDQGHYDFLIEIEQKVLSGYYTRQAIAFDPTNDDGTNWLEEYQDLPLLRPIPAALVLPTPGIQAHQGDFIEGFPVELIDAVEKQLEDFDS